MEIFLILFSWTEFLLASDFLPISFNLILVFFTLSRSCWIHFPWHLVLEVFLSVHSPTATLSSSLTLYFHVGHFCYLFTQWNAFISKFIWYLFMGYKFLLNLLFMFYIILLNSTNFLLLSSVNLVIILLSIISYIFYIWIHWAPYWSVFQSLPLSFHNIHLFSFWFPPQWCSMVQLWGRWVLGEVFCCLIFSYFYWGFIFHAEVCGSIIVEIICC